MVALLVVLTVLAFLTVDYFLQKRHAVVVAPSESPAGPAGVFGRAGYRVPQGVFFAPGHTWMHLEDSGVARLGVDDFATSIVGNIDEIRALDPGQKVRKGDPILHLRHGDREITLRSPIDGEIRDINRTILESRDMLGTDPHAASWVYRVKPDDTSSLMDGMMLGQAAKEWLRREVSRLKVFLSTIAPEHPVLGATMQDGGLPSYGLIDFMDEDEWSKLRDKFLS